MPTVTLYLIEWPSVDIRCIAKNRTSKGQSKRNTRDIFSFDNLCRTEVVFGRQLRLSLTPSSQAKQHQPMLQTKVHLIRKCVIIDPVYAHDCRRSQNNWQLGWPSSEWHGVMHEVNMGRNIWIRYDSQLRKRVGSEQMEHTRNNGLPLKILYENFGFPNS